MLRATYSYEDNKFRLYSENKESLTKENIEELKKRSFRYAPRQKLWVSASWNPLKEDFLLKLTDKNIELEEKTILDRAKEKQEAMLKASEKKKLESSEAFKKSHDPHMPFGQPIITGTSYTLRLVKRRDKQIAHADRGVELSRKAERLEHFAEHPVYHALCKQTETTIENRIKRLKKELRDLLKLKNYSPRWEVHLNNRIYYEENKFKNVEFIPD